MSDDEEDMFSQDSGPENQSITADHMTSNQPITADHVINNQSITTDASVSVVEETSPIVHRSQRPGTRARPRNLSHSVILLDSSEDEDGRGQIQNNLNRVSQINQEAAQMPRQVEDDIGTVSNQVNISTEGREPVDRPSSDNVIANSTSIHTESIQSPNHDTPSDIQLPYNTTAPSIAASASTSLAAASTSVTAAPISVTATSSSFITAISSLSAIPASGVASSSALSAGSTEVPDVSTALSESVATPIAATSSTMNNMTAVVSTPVVQSLPTASDEPTVTAPSVPTVSTGARISPYFPQPTTATRGLTLNASSAEFQNLSDESPEVKVEKKGKKKKAKKRKATNSIDDDDEGSCCTICFEAWSNSGEHRISSLRCGHFFGYTCIEKWLKGNGSSCPNCNEKTTKKDIRVHYVAKLKAIDTSEKDRALADLEKEKTSNRELQLRLTEYQVRNKLFQEEIEKLQRELHQYRKFRGDLPAALQSSQPAAVPTQPTRLVYQRRYEIVRGNEKSCRVLAYSEYLGMLLISQPSFTALAPGYGVRQFNVLDMKVGNFISLCKDQIRDLSFSRVSPHLLLSCGHDRSVRITNISNGNKVVEFNLEHQVWACDWAANNDYQIFLGTNKGSILIHDTRDPGGNPQQLNFPTRETKPIIGLRSVPARPEAGFPHPGFLVMNLTSVWYWHQETAEEATTWTCCKLNIEQRLLWSLDFEADSFLVLVGCKPSPLASHLVLELTSTQIDSGRTYIGRPIMTGKGGSFSQRSFLRSSLLPSPNGQVYLAFSKGTGQSDHKVVIQEVGSDRVLQELKVDRPVIDIKHVKLNDDRYLALLGETDLTMYKWNQV